MAGSSNATELRIILIGKTGAGKSATGNTIIQDKKFKSASSSRSVTMECEKHCTEIDGRRIVVVDTPGFFDTEVAKEETSEKIQKVVNLSYPGPHAIIQVVQLGRFSEEEKKVAHLIQNMFSLKAKTYMIILFTRREDLEDRSLRAFLLEGDKDLQNQIAQCGGRCLAFNNRATGQERADQVAELLQMIDGMVERNKEAPYYTECLFEKDKKVTYDKYKNLYYWLCNIL